MKRNMSSIQPMDTLSILTKTNRPRNRKWEKENPAISFYLPIHLNERSVKVRGAINAISIREAAQVAQVSQMLMEYGIACYERGDIPIQTYPNPNARKLNLIWEEVESWPQELQQTPQQPKRLDARRWHPSLSFRWDGDLRSKIIHIAQKHAAKPGEIVLMLLEYAVERYKSGKMSVKKIQPIVENKITGWEEKK